MREKSIRERRKYIRLNSVFPVEIYPSTQVQDSAPGGIHAPRLIQGFTRDVSLGGFCLTVNGPEAGFLSAIKDEKSLFRVHINMPITHRPIEAEARVAWHEIKDTDHHKQLKLGIFYEKIAPADKKRIVNAARRMMWLPRIAVFAIIALICLFGFTHYRAALLAEKNKALIERFYKTQEISDTYKKAATRIDKKYAALMEELALKEGPEAEALKREIKVLLARKKKAAELLKGAEKKRRELEKATVENMYQWLKTHQNRFTGLVMSFEGDPSIRNWAFTYDQALALQVFLISGDTEKAEKILSFYKEKAKKEKDGYYNAYRAVTGNPAEHTVNIGPNVWMAIAALQYTEKTKDKKYLGMAQDIAKWVILLKDKDGGIKGGPRFSWYSTEHNLDAYALFNMLYGITGKKIYGKEKMSTLRWIKENTYTGKSGRMKRGKGDATIATDTMAWAIAALGPVELLKEGMDPVAIIKFAEDHCAVTTDFRRPDGTTVTVTGFDFGKSKNVARGGVVSSEWTAQMVIAFRMMADFYSALDETKKAVEFNKKADFYLSELDKMIISSPSRSGQGAGCLPYATQPNADTGHGWRTPQGADTGSVAGTAYTIFAKKNYNPLSLD